MNPVLVETGIDSGLAWHYGNPVAEARAMAAGQAVVELGNREVLEISGPDRLDWLHSLTAQQLAGLPPGEAIAALILSPNGHIEHVLHGVDDGESFLAWTEPGHRAALIDFLEKMKFRMEVSIRARDDLSLCWFGQQVPIPAGAATRVDQLGGIEVFWPREAALPEAVLAGTWAYEAARIEAGVPRIFLDTDHRTLPNEIGLFGTRLDKGCYRGQETVARVYNLGRPPRRLVKLHLDGSASVLPSAAAELRLADQPESQGIGFVGGSSRHHELGPIALGLVKRSIPVAAELSVEGIPAAQEVLVDPDVGLHIRPKLG